MKREIYPLFDGTFWLADELAHNNKPNGYAVTKERKEGGGGNMSRHLNSFCLFHLLKYVWELLSPKATNPTEKT